MVEQREEPTNVQKAIAGVISILIIVAIVFVTMRVFSFGMGVITDDTPEYEREEIKEKMEEHLYEKYGEEFVVSRIGRRRMRDDRFYQARIYPKSIIGTNKQGDDYYYASASIDIKSSGELGGVGDSYSYVVRNMDVEEYLLPKTKKIFGDRVLLKVDAAHQVTGDGSWWAGYKSESLEEMRADIEDKPDQHRIKLDLDVYIFDRIEDDKEKDERREDIFEFVQHLQEEELFEYLEMRVVFVDERVLADSYDKYEREIRSSDKERVKIEGTDTIVKLPPKNLREEMSQELQAEVSEMSEEELLDSMQQIRKDKLNYEGIGKYNRQYFLRVISINMMKEQPYGEYREIKEEGNLERHKYHKKEDILFGRESAKYILLGRFK